MRQRAAARRSAEASETSWCGSGEEDEEEEEEESRDEEEYLPLPSPLIAADSLSTAAPAAMETPRRAKPSARASADDGTRRSVEANGMTSSSSRSVFLADGGVERA